MNKTYKLSYILPVVIIVLVFAFSAFDNKENNTQPVPVIQDKDHVNKPAELVSSRKSSSEFENISLFNKSGKDNSSALNTFVSKASFLKIDRRSLQQFN